jgi:outer membrane protein assembly factor BamB
MNFIKVGQIKNIMNSNSFIGLPQKKLIGVLHQNRELLLYKDFKLQKTVVFPQVGTLEKKIDTDQIVFSRDSTSIFFVNTNTFAEKSSALSGQITAKIGNDYLIDNENLVNFETGHALKIEKHVNLFRTYGTYYPANSKCGFIFGHSKTTKTANFFKDAEGTYVSGYSLKTGQGIWEYSFKPELGDEQRHPSHFQLDFLGNNQTQVWLLVSNGQIVVLDVQTGKELKRIGQPIWSTTQQEVEKALHQLGRSYLEDNKWISLNKYHYLEISAKTFKLKYVNLQEEFDKYNISCMLSCFNKKYIYFYDSNWMSHSARGKVAVLDRKTLKIVWYWDMLKELGTAPLHIEVVDNQFYVLDNGLTLHVFDAAH